MTEQEQRDAQGRERLQRVIDDQHKKEKASRPNAAHRALVFILKHVAQNNRDAAREANFYIAELDRAFAPIHEDGEPDDDEAPLSEPGTDASGDGTAPDNPDNPGDPGTTPRASRRFRGRT